MYARLPLAATLLLLTALPLTARAQEIGVVLAAGTDGLLNPSVDPLPMLHRKLEVMVSGAGLTPMQALVAATHGAAHAIGDEANRGTVAAGRAADVLLLDAKSGG